MPVQECGSLPWGGGGLLYAAKSVDWSCKTLNHALEALTAPLHVLSPLEGAGEPCCLHQAGAGQWVAAPLLAPAVPPLDGFQQDSYNSLVFPLALSLENSLQAQAQAFLMAALPYGSAGSICTTHFVFLSTAGRKSIAGT